MLMVQINCYSTHLAAVHPGEPTFLFCTKCQTIFLVKGKVLHVKSRYVAVEMGLIVG